MFGTGERVLRLLPVLFGLGTLATAFWIGKRWLDPVGATVLAILCAFSEWLPFYPLELKPYSADAFWALLLPALAAWAVGVDPRERGRESSGAASMAPSWNAVWTRTLIWWSVAAMGQWFGNGALFVAPPCALILGVALWRQSGLGVAYRFAAQGAIWLVAFGLHYQWAMTYTVHSDFLRGYWVSGFPPVSAGFIGTLRWLGNSLSPFAFKPAGTTLGLVFWLVATLGLIAMPSGGGLLAVLYGALPLCAFIYAGVRAVPFVERLALWVVPPLYVGVASLTGWAARMILAEARGLTVGVAPPRLTGTRMLVGFVSSIAAFSVAFDIFSRGYPDFAPPPRSENHLLDDRSAVGWLKSQREPSDIMMTTHLGLPALWWYGGSTVSGLLATRMEQSADIPALEVRYVPNGAECQPNAVREALRGHDRVLVYLGFRFDDVPRGFDDLLMQRLSELGAVVGYRRFADFSRAAIFELHAQPSAPPAAFLGIGTALANPATPDKPASPASPFWLASAASKLPGCLAIQAAEAW
jgi:hypothetical protein